MNQRILARDSTGLYYLRKLCNTTAAGHVVQTISPSAPGAHRTWHATGYVHDRSTAPPSTSSEGQRPNPALAVDEVWVREILVAGELGAIGERTDDSPSPDDILVDLVRGPQRQRLEVRITTLATASAIEARLRSERSGNLIHLQLWQDGGSVRIVTVDVP